MRCQSCLTHFRTGFFRLNDDDKFSLAFKIYVKEWEIEIRGVSGFFLCRIKAMCTYGLQGECCSIVVARVN